ncbi:kynurenine 3-monooxygenase [Nitrospirillum amazonense]|uniref:Kynurenine 3-monooxygenase n=1 Tax=Nitrospirillum amazonense TaxID=28077 RepID=A0A560ESQ4_9PROT|nr:NAD(P)/FAD-dependent oxidoreductase [Nitrospirillum amazonense]TWB12400.1 kynurenine 3-monooxygenase [Nitrospirillum amazonense]
MTEVVIIGGGLAGLAAAGLLARRGVPVTVLEAQADPRLLPQRPKGRSINLALSARGIRTLEVLDAIDLVRPLAVPMFGRQIHDWHGGEEFQPYDQVGNRAIHSVRRSTLIDALTAVAAGTPNLTLKFGHRCVSIDTDAKTIRVADELGRTMDMAFGALIGADGTHSLVRDAIAKQAHAPARVETLRHCYKELAIPADRAAGLAPNALHIWPRGDVMLIALPNREGSFTATLFFPRDGRLDERQSLDAQKALFDDLFPGVEGALLSDLDRQLAANPTGRIVTTSCESWTAAPGLLVLGDAAHAMAPFYGQGMNCALEDCLKLAAGVPAAEPGGWNWTECFKAFATARRGDVQAIMDLSLSNYSEMSHHVIQDGFRLRRQVEGELARAHPDRFTPLYEMVAFSDIPYAEALARARRQDLAISRWTANKSRREDVNLAAIVAELDTIGYPLA